MDGDSFLLRRFGIIGAQSLTYVRIGNFFVHPNHIQRYLGSYAQRFVNCSYDPIFQFSFLGTATGIKFRERYFTIAKNHQRKLGEDGRLGIICRDGESAASPRNMWPMNFLDEINREDEYDFIIYEFNLDDYVNGPNISQFFPVNSNDSSELEILDFALNLGFPYRLHDIDYLESKVDTVLVSNFVRFVEILDGGILRFMTLNEERFFEDGMSGSPVFGISNNNDIYQANWLGIVVRGGEKSRFGRVIPSSIILGIIEDNIIDA